MNLQLVKPGSLLCIATLLLAACGGTGINSMPPPVATPSPAPALASPVELLKAPTTQEFSTFAAGNPLRIRYDAATRKYEVMAPGRNWDSLIHDPLSQSRLFLFASAPTLNSGYFSARTGHDHAVPALRYQYSSLASWQLTAPDKSGVLRGVTAFGTATPRDGVPLSGGATYQGQIEGAASIPATSGWGNFDRAPIEGTVSLRFDFANGSFGGQIVPRLACDCDPIDFPALSFADTNFAIGSQTFSGRFATAASGSNAFSGLFTGPNAQELIGQWAFPIAFKGSSESATGVWIAKRGN